MWNTETKEFLDYSLKAKAYEILVRKFKEVDPNANKDTVIRMINRLKKSYFNEINKIRTFSQSAVEGDYYTSNLWYFNLLNFLQISLSSIQNYSNAEDDESIEQVRYCYVIYCKVFIFG